MTPTPPEAPQGRDLGPAIEGFVNDALAGVLAKTRAELAQELSRLEAKNVGLEAAASAAPNGPAQAAIRGELARNEREMAKLRSAIDKLDRQLSTRDGPNPAATPLPAPRIAGTTPAPPGFPRQPMDNFDPTPLVFGVMGILFVAFPLTLALVRFLWKRASNAPAPAITAEQSRRFDRLEQSVDSIAIEVERISENQRYLTKLLADTKQPSKIGG